MPSFDTRLQSTLDQVRDIGLCDVGRSARFDDPASRQFFGDIAAGETSALQLLRDFAARVGLDEQDLAAYEPYPQGRLTPPGSPELPPTPTGRRRGPRSW